MRRDRYVPQEPPYLLYALLGASLSMNLYMVLDQDRPLLLDEPVTILATETTLETVANLAPAALVEVAPTAVTPEPVEEASLEPAEELLAVPLVEPPPVQVDTGYDILNADVSHSLARTFQGEISQGADVLTAVFSRIFMWDLDLRRDVQRGDQIALAYGPAIDPSTTDLPVASYKSNKLRKTLRGYRFQARGDAYASYWDEDGIEVPRRLVGGPIEGYEQITSLLKDRPNHHGIDFKAAVGTEVFSPKAGTVTRVNWNTRSNGGCIEVRYADGTMARFLHLEKTQVKAGHHVKAGQVIALSGNSGNSTAPHLHYELSRGKTVLDPLDYHGTVRRRLDDNSLPSFQLEVARLDALLGGSRTEQ